MVAELNAVMENRVHGLVKCHKRAQKKLPVLKGYMHTIGRHRDRVGAKDGRQGSRHREGR
jgi:hypothetical protein